MKIRAKPLLVLVALFASLFACRSAASAVQSAAGTAISNVATFSYSSGSNTFNGQSNTLTIYVQNAPVLTVGAPTGQNVTPAMIVVDSFTLTNTGNGSGNFQLSGDATLAGTAGATLLGYVYGSNCTIASPCTESVLNNSSNLNAVGNVVAAGNSATVGVEYQVSASAANASTILTTLSANITYAAGTGTTQVTSSNVTGTPTDTQHVNTRLDSQAAASISGATIVWTVTAENGAGYAAQGLASAQALFGASDNGIVIFVPTPSFSGTPLTLQSQPSTPTLNGASSGAVAVLYYNATACSSSPNSGWSLTYSASALCIAVYVSNSTASVLPLHTGAASSAGNVPVPEITYTFTTNQPSGSGSGNANAVTLITSSAVGGHTWATGAVPIVGRGIAVGAQNDAATASLLNAIQANTTASSGVVPPGGASNQAGSSASGSYAVFNGPLKIAAATGSYPVGGGTASPTTDLDFTAMGFECTNGGMGVYGGGANCSVPPNIQIPNTVQNTGNLTDSITISVTPPAGWTAQIFTATCPAGPFTAVPTCTGQSSISSVSAAGTIVTSSGISLASTASQDYVVQYNNGSGVTPFMGVDALVTANGTGDTNNTHNDIYPGGVISIATTATVTTSNCPAGVTVTAVCPGGTLKYVTTYANTAPAGSVVTNVGTEPSFAYAALMASAAGLTIASDGTISNGWALNTFGLNGTAVTGSAAPAASDTTNSTVTAYTGCPGSCVSSSAWAGGTYPAISIGPNKIAALVAKASASVAPGGTGSLTYYVTVK
jgi:hypothetical protein